MLFLYGGGVFKLDTNHSSFISFYQLPRDTIGPISLGFESQQMHQWLIQSFKPLEMILGLVSILIRHGTKGLLHVPLECMKTKPWKTSGGQNRKITET